RARPWIQHQQARNRGAGQQRRSPVVMHGSPIEKKSSACLPRPPQPDEWTLLTALIGLARPDLSMMWRTGSASAASSIRVGEQLPLPGDLVTRQPSTQQVAPSPTSHYVVAGQSVCSLPSPLEFIIGRPQPQSYRG